MLFKRPQILLHSCQVSPVACLEKYTCFVRFQFESLYLQELKDDLKHYNKHLHIYIILQFCVCVCFEMLSEVPGIKCYFTRAIICNIDILTFLSLINYKINYIKTLCYIMLFLNCPSYQQDQLH
jgi:hypothetical protein